jgi:hypothetical protein
MMFDNADHVGNGDCRDKHLASLRQPQFAQQKIETAANGQESQYMLGIGKDSLGELIDPRLFQGKANPGDPEQQIRPAYVKSFSRPHFLSLCLFNISGFEQSRL